MTEIASQRLHVIRTDFSGDSDAEAFDFYQAESLKLQFIPGSDWSNRVPMPDGGSCKMEAWLSADPDTLYINKTGTVDSATDRATIELARAETNFATGTYLYTVKVFDSGDTQTGVIASGQFTVKYSPDSDSVDYVGTTTYPVASDITYDNTTSELTATNVQTAIDELDAAIDQLEGTITITARNETGVQIDKGSVVYISGSTGNRSTVAFADANIGATAQKTIGVAFANIAHNSDGDIVVLGELSGVDLSDFEDGDELYLSETPGGIANTPPAGDADWSYRIGYAETAQNNGKLLVAPQFRGTVYGANFFAATSASGVRTTLDVPSNSEAVLVTGEQGVAGTKTFTDLAYFQGGIGEFASFMPFIYCDSAKLNEVTPIALDPLQIKDGAGDTQIQIDVGSVSIPNGIGIGTSTYSASQTLTATECKGYVIYVTGAATITLPSVADGMHVTVITIGDVEVSVDPNASDKIWLDGVALDDGDKITNGSASGDIAVLTYYSADGWHGSTNGWTDGGA